MKIVKLTGIYEKRFKFVQDIIKECTVSKILDIGCGTGVYLTIPIAINNPNINIVGFDIDRTTILNNVKNNICNNITYKHTLTKDDFYNYDIVILSEVLEHIKEPINYLNKLKKYLKNDGSIILTIPNGYGSYEIDCFIRGLYVFLKTTIITLFVNSKKLGKGEKENSKKYKNYIKNKSLLPTLNDSAHINFFSYRNIRKIITETGYYINAYEARGFIWIERNKFLIKNKYIVKFNCFISDFILPQFVLGWMFELKVDKNKYKYKRNLREKFQCHLNKAYLGYK